MRIAVLLEPVSNDKYCACSPALGIKAEGASENEAIAELRQQLQKRIGDQTEILEIEITPEQAPRLLSLTGVDERFEGADEVLFLIPTNLTRPFFANLLQHCEARVDSLFGDTLRTIVRYVPRDQDEFQTDEVIRLLRREFRLSKRVRVLIVAPTGSARLSQDVAKFLSGHDRTLPVIAFTLPFHDDASFGDSGLPHPASLVCQNEIGTRLLGADVARYYANPDKEINVVLLRGAEGRLDSEARVEGFLEGLRSAKVPFVVVPDEPLYCDWSRRKARETFSDIVRSLTQDIHVVFAANDEMALGAHETIRAASNDIKHWIRQCVIYGFDAIPDMSRLVLGLDKYLKGTVGQPWDKMANELVDMIEIALKTPDCLEPRVIEPKLVVAPDAKTLEIERSSAPPPYDGSIHWRTTGAVPTGFGEKKSLGRLARDRKWKGKDKHGEYGICGKRDPIRKYRREEGVVYWYVAGFMGQHRIQDRRTITSD